jgi:cytoskeleton protein RodZ
MNDIRTLSFGRYLKAVRLQKGISLKHVAEETKIGMDTLLSIEREEHQHLPVEVYVKGFIRSYSKAIGADGDLAIQNYQNSRNIFQRSAQSENDLKKAEKGFWPRLLLSLGALVFFMVLSISGIYILKENPQPDRPSESQSTKASTGDTPLSEPEPSQPSEEEQRKGGEQPKPEALQEFQPVVDLNSSSGEAVSEERLLLHIKASEETWVKVIVDNRNANEYTLKPGDRLALEASLGYNLLIGNAGGLSLTLNGEPVEVPGRSGQVVTIQIP